MEPGDCAGHPPKELTCGEKGKACDGALQMYGISSLGALVSQMNASNVFDGRTSPYSDKLTGPNATAGALVPNGDASTFLGDYFFDPSPLLTAGTQRALILLHESVHQFGPEGHRLDTDFPRGSKGLTDMIAEKCTPAFHSLKLLGNLQF